MQMTMRAAIALAALAVAGCATSTGVVEVGDGSYLIGGKAPPRMSSTEVKVGLFEQASEFCVKTGKKPAIVSDSGQDGQMGIAMPVGSGRTYVGAGAKSSAEVRFTCQ